MLQPLQLLAVATSFLVLLTTASPPAGTNGQSRGILPRNAALSNLRQTIKQKIVKGLLGPSEDYKGEFYDSIMSKALSGLSEAAEQAKNQKIKNPYLAFSIIDSHPGFVLLRVNEEYGAPDPRELERLGQSDFYYLVPMLRGNFYQTICHNKVGLDGFARYSVKDIKLEFIVSDAPKIFEESEPKTARRPIDWDREFRENLEKGNHIIPIDPSFAPSSSLIQRSVLENSIGDEDRQFPSSLPPRSTSSKYYTQILTRALEGLKLAAKQTTESNPQRIERSTSDERSISKSPISLRPRTTADVLAIAFDSLKKALTQAQLRSLNDPYIIFSHETGLLAIPANNEYDENNLQGMTVYTLTPEKKLGASSYNTRFSGTNLGDFAADNPSKIQPLYMVEDGYSTLFSVSRGASFSKAENCKATITKALEDSNQIINLEFDTTGASKKNRRAVYDSDSPSPLFSYENGLIAISVIGEYQDIQSIHAYQLVPVQTSLKKPIFTTALYAKILGDFAKTSASKTRPEFIAVGGISTLLDILRRSSGQYPSASACKDELIKNFQKYANIISLAPRTSNKHRRTVSKNLGATASQGALHLRSDASEERIADILSIAILSLKKASRQIKSQGISGASLVFSYEGTTPGYLTIVVGDSYNKWEVSDIVRMIDVAVSTYSVEEVQRSVYIPNMVPINTLPKFAKQNPAVTTITPAFIALNGFAAFNKNAPKGPYLSPEAWRDALVMELGKAGIYLPLDQTIFSAPQSQRRSITDVARATAPSSPARTSLLPRMEFQMSHFSIIMTTALTNLKLAALQAEREKIAKPSLVFSTGPDTLPGFMVISVKKIYKGLNDVEDISTLHDTRISLYQATMLQGAIGSLYKASYSLQHTLGEFASTTPTEIRPEFMISNGETAFDRLIPIGEFATSNEWRDAVIASFEGVAIPLKDPRSLSP